MSLAFSLKPVARQQYRNPATDLPLSGGTVEFFLAGGSTPAPVYTTSAGTVPLGTSVTLDACGFAPAIYLDAGAYKEVVKDVDGAEIYTQDVVMDVGQTFFATIGEQWLEGGDHVASGYEVLHDDAFVTVASTGGANPAIITLPTAANHPGPLGIKNLGTIHIHVVPQGGDNIEGLAQVYEIPAAVSPLFPTIWLMADGGSNWWIVASHGVPT